MKKVILISLPRSGSTLLQKLIETDRRVESSSEGWILLPIFMLGSSDNVNSTYGDSAVSKVLIENEYRFGLKKKEIIDGMASSYLSKVENILGKDKIYLDKTPRYYQIVNELIDSKIEFEIIILTRPILEIIASYDKTFSGFWSKLPLFKNEFIDGVIALDKAMKNKLVMSVSYSELVENITEVENKINNHLKLETNNKLINFKERKGMLGDPNYGSYSKIVKHKSSIDVVSFFYYKVFIKPKLKHIEGRGFSGEEVSLTFGITSIFNFFQIPIMTAARLLNLKIVVKGIKHNKYYL